MTPNFPRKAVQGLALAVALLACCSLALPVVAARAADSTLRIAISLSDIPNLWAAPDGGFEGVRFGGYTIFDSLVEWDLTSASQPSRLIPGLAVSWSADPANPKRWTFALRNTTFHDGSPWNADAAIWSLDAVLKKDAPQFNSTRAGLNGSKVATIASYGKVDDHTIYIETKVPDGFLLYELASFFFASPAQFAAVGNNWQKFAQSPSGTGPYVFVGLQPKRELDLKANENYWNKDRIPKTKSLALLPIPDANTRVAALRSGQVDLVDTLPPDAIESLKAAGFIITQNTYPHTWLWRLNFTPESPFSDVRVRKAANLAIDRDAIVQLLNGSATPAKGFAPPTSPWFGHPSFELKYDPDAARALLAEAGYSPDHPAKVTIVISSSGGGQMVPLSMNEIIQENLHDVGIDVTYDVRDFTAMINMLRQGAKTVGADAINVAMTMQDPPSGIAAYASNLAPPAGGNWGFYNNPDFDKAISAARAEFDPLKQEAALAHVNEVLTDDAAALLVVHDTGPRALSPKLKGFVQVQNWYQDFTSIEKSE
jgi:peptide/nickel transport system substrate-binding protein